jgi:hypothetical protein
MHVPLPLVEALDRQLILCDQLEEIADSLPDRVDRQLCLEVARSVVLSTKHFHDVEDRLVFQQLLDADSSRGAWIEELRLERIADEYKAEEVQQELRAFAQGQSKLAPEAIGYLLRGFFDGSRRHVRHCRELLRVAHGA